MVPVFPDVYSWPVTRFFYCPVSVCSNCTDGPDPSTLVILENNLVFSFPFFQVQTMILSSFFLKLMISVTPFLLS